MNAMNQESNPALCLADLMGHPDGWGRSQGREVFRSLVEHVESRPGVRVFFVSLNGVRRTDISFASETLVELAKRYRGNKGFCLTDMTDADMVENWDAAARKASQPIMVLESNGQLRVLGIEPTPGNQGAFRFALERTSSRATEFAAATGIGITNASTKFKQLWEQGFLLRRENLAASGGFEFEYFRIG
jgi:hypothetical protein